MVMLILFSGPDLQLTQNTEDHSLLDPNVLKPMSRLGGITYGRVVDGLEIPRPVLKVEKEQGKIPDKLLQPKVDGQ